MMRSRILLLLLITALFPLVGDTLAGSTFPAAAGTSDDVQVIEVTAKKYDFSPSPIRVMQGKKVQLRITATDRSHGFKINEFAEDEPKGSSPGLVFSSSAPNCVEIQKNQPQTIEFLAHTPGTYTFKCCVRCGWHHRSMKGELIVEP